MGTALPIARDMASEVVATVREEIADSSVIQIVCDISQNGKSKGKWFPGLAKRLSRDKAPAAIHHLTGEKERTCYDWCGGVVDPPARAIIKLLHSPAGWLVLEYVMRGCKQPWWVEIARARQCAKAFDCAREQFEIEFR